MHADAQLLQLGGPTSPTESQSRAVGQHIESILADMIPLVTINPQLAPFNTNPAFKRAVQLAVDRAVREVSSVLRLSYKFFLTFFADYSSCSRAVSDHLWYLDSRARRQGLRCCVRRYTQASSAGTGDDVGEAAAVTAVAIPTTLRTAPSSGSSNSTKRACLVRERRNGRKII